MSAEFAAAGFAGIVCLAYLVQTVSGFAFVLVCVSFGALLLPIRDVVALAVPLSLLQTTYIVIRHRAHIQVRMLVTGVLPIMLTGLLVGWGSAHYLDGPWLRVVFAAFVAAVSLRELVRSRFAAADSRARPLPRTVRALALLLAGAFQGIYGTGGPMLVYVFSREPLSKGELRASLSAIWFVLNLFLVGGLVWDGRYGGPFSPWLLLILLAIPCGIAAGEWLHHRVSERRFRDTLFGLLLVAATTLLIKALA